MRCLTLIACFPLAACGGKAEYESESLSDNPATGAQNRGDGMPGGEDFEPPAREGATDLPPEGRDMPPEADPPEAAPPEADPPLDPTPELQCSFAQTLDCVGCVAATWESECADIAAALDSEECRPSVGCVESYCACPGNECAEELCSCTATCIEVGSECERLWGLLLECSQQECRDICD